jgi:hypothetical protein
MTLILRNHTGGLFSISSVILFEIIKHKKNTGINPEILDSSNTYAWYRYTNKNIFYDFFKISDINKLNNVSLMDFEYELYGSMQFMNYSTCKLDVYFKYAEVYFNLSDNVMNIYNTIVNKYNIDFENTCCLFLRGNDKATECRIPSYNSYIITATQILKENPNLKILIQSDEKEFIDTMSKHFKNNIVFLDEIRVINRDIRRTVDNHGMTPELNHHYALKFLAIVYIMSKCKYVVCNSGNISFWILMYRQHLKNFFQLGS